MNVARAAGALALGVVTSVGAWTGAAIAQDGGVVINKPKPTTTPAPKPAPKPKPKPKPQPKPKPAPKPNNTPPEPDPKPPVATSPESNSPPQAPSLQKASFDIGDGISVD